MRLSCPGCQTEYEVPDAALAGRVRTLRCAHCSHQWEYGPLAVALPLADPAGAAWPGAAPRSVFSDLPKPAQPEIRARATTTDRYEPLEAPARGAWPPPRESEPASSYEPLTTARAIPETVPDEFAPEPAASAAGEPEAQPELAPETQTKAASGNEERFAALVKTSRNESDDAPGPGARAGLFTTIILLIGIGAGIWAARFHIMQIWPPSIRLFDAINLFITNLTTPPHH